MFVLVLSPMAKEIKAKINRRDMIKVKSFCTAKIITDKMKRQLTELEKIFANYMVSHGLIFKMCELLVQLNIKWTSNSF